MAVCLVTGGAGFVGSHLVEALVARNHVVRVLDHPDTGDFSNLAGVRHRIEVITGKLTKYQVVREATEGVEYVYHQAGVAPRNLHPGNLVAAHQAHLTSVLHVLTAARDAQVRRVIYASTSRAYGDAPRCCLREADPTMPFSPHAITELTGEQHCLSYTCLYGLDTVRLRTFNAFGPRQARSCPGSILAVQILQAMLKGESPVIYGTGLESYDLIYVEDVIHANLLAAEASRVAGRVYNVARNRPTNALEVIALINKLQGTQLQPTYSNRPRPDGFLYNLADTSRGEAELGFCPCMDLEQSLRRCIAHYTSSSEELAASGCSSCGHSN